MERLESTDLKKDVDGLAYKVKRETDTGVRRGTKQDAEFTTGEK